MFVPTQYSYTLDSIGDDDTVPAHAHQCIQLISGIIPLVVLIGLNTRIYIAIKKRMQAREGTILTYSYRISLIGLSLGRMVLIQFQNQFAISDAGVDVVAAAEGRGRGGRARRDHPRLHRLPQLQVLRQLLRGVRHALQ